MMVCNTRIVLRVWFEFACFLGGHFSFNRKICSTPLLKSMRRRRHNQPLPICAVGWIGGWFRDLVMVNMEFSALDWSEGGVIGGSGPTLIVNGKSAFHRMEKCMERISTISPNPPQRLLWPAGGWYICKHLFGGGYTVAERGGGGCGTSRVDFIEPTQGAIQADLSGIKGGNTHIVSDSRWIATINSGSGDRARHPWL